MGCAIGTVRYILFFFNFLLALAGLGIIIVGMGIAFTKSATVGDLDVVHNQLILPAMMFTIVGACVFVFAFFGCWGALRENHCMICTYAVLLLTLFVLQVAVAVLAYKYREKAKEPITQSFVKLFAKYENNTNIHEWVDKIQEEFKCCGSSDPQTPWSKFGETPPSCYPDGDKGKHSFNEGCAPALISKVGDNLAQIYKIAGIVAAVQVAGIVFALCLANSLKRSELRGYA